MKCLTNLFLLVITVCIVSGCQRTATQSYRRTPSTPNAVQAEEDEIFAIRWFGLPYSGAFYQLGLKTDNQIYFWRVIWEEGTHGQGYTQLTDTEVQEIRTLLAGLVNNSRVIPLESNISIKISFHWNNAIRTESFDENCPSELHRIFEIVEEAYVRDGRVRSKWIPCQN
jgi:hypothetical protein